MITPFEIFLSTLPSQELAHHPAQLHHKPETTQESPPLNPYKKSLLIGSSSHFARLYREQYGEQPRDTFA